MNLPVNTYRIQFNRNFTFKNLREIIPYLVDLGIDCIYASPVFKALPGSNHGYDITDPQQINPEIGTFSELKNLKKELQIYNIKWIQDIVPNHMAFHPENFWLMDVLEKKKESEYYNFFDINWHHPYSKGKLMAPFLGETIDEAIDGNKIKLRLTDEGVHIHYHDHAFPASINSYKYILEAANYLKRKVLSIINRDEEIQENLDRFSKNKPLLKEFLDLQNFQLVHWQTTDKQINYRRFFTINGLICLKMEEEYVFSHYHKFIFSMIKEGIFDGLRIDHIDGLLDPTVYIAKIRKEVGKEVPLVVEKILEEDEHLPENWHVQGTTGYDFLAHINKLLTDQSKTNNLIEIYQKYTDKTANYNETIFNNKLRFLNKFMAGELNNLYSMLKEVLPEVGKEALSALLAGMPVYRLYPSQKGLTDYDKEILDKAAKKVISFSKVVSIDPLLTFLKNGNDEQWYYFMQRFQQLSGPLAAKGIEDTTFYQYNVLISHNEVGNSPDLNDYSSKEFSNYIIQRKDKFKDSFNATATHDTKRGEDARTRINTISEQPEQWKKYLGMFKEQNQKIKINSIPDNNDEYFLYQTISGTYPVNGIPENNYLERLKNYMIKVVREGKVNSDWAQPNEIYENNLLGFLDGIFKNDKFTSSLSHYVKTISFWGALNSLSQTTLKYTLPGIADTYQGSELWDFSFVDPDNRLPVDYELRKKLLSQQITADEVKNMLHKNCNSPEIKLFFIYKLLKLRLANEELFLFGDFTPFKVDGYRSENVYAFKREFEDKNMIVATGRHLSSVYQNELIHKEAWSENKINVDLAGEFQNVLTGETSYIDKSINIIDIFKYFPVAVLINK